MSREELFHTAVLDPELAELERLYMLPPARPPHRRRLRRRLRTTLVCFVGFMVVGNLAILAASAWAKVRHGDGAIVSVEGVRNFRVVDDQVWRGGAPSMAGYQSLADQGVTTVVDLRAEAVDEVDGDTLSEMGLDRVTIPIRDGQNPAPAQVEKFLEVLEGTEAPVFLHCGAGVGRSGAMTAAYLTATGQADGPDRIAHNLSVGPPSLEQIVYAGTVDSDFSAPNPLVVATSRVLDAPRRIFHQLGF